MTFFDLFCKQIVNEKTPPAEAGGGGLFGVFHKIVPGLLDIVLNFGLQLLGGGESALRPQAAAELHPDGFVVEVAAEIQQEGLHFNGITAAAAVIELLIELIESALRNNPLLPLLCKNYTIDSIWMVCCFSCELCRLRHILFRAMDRKMRFGKKQVKTGTFCMA